MSLYKNKARLPKNSQRTAENGDVEVSKEKLLVLRKIATNLGWAQEDKPQNLSEQVKVVGELMHHEEAILEAHGVLDASKEESDGEVTVLQTI